MFQCNGESKITCITTILGAPWIWPWNNNLLPFFSWWQAFTFCSSMANGDDYLKFDEGEKIFHQSPTLLFALCFLSFDYHSYFSLVKKLKLVIHGRFFYLLGILSFVIHLCFTFTATNCALKSPFFHIHDHLFSSPFPCYSYHETFIFKY